MNRQEFITALFARAKDAGFDACEVYYSTSDSFSVGGRVQIWGRIQSREYQKKLSETEIETRIAYEVSVSKLDYLEAIAPAQ